MNIFNFIKENNIKMDLPNLVSAIRFEYNGDLINVNNVLNQIGIRSNEKAEEISIRRTKNCIDCLFRLGWKPEDKNTEKILKDFISE